MKMTDGNKESIKELLSTFRSLFAITVSGLFLIITSLSKGQIVINFKVTFWIGVAAAVCSALLMIYLFFLAIPKIAEEEEAIIERRDIKIVSLTALFFFFAAYVSVIFSVSL